jgi:uncharacterized protein YndB with AHSA1/START domain
MAEYERTATIRARATDAFEYLSDPRHLPEYVATMTGAQPAGQGQLRVAAEVEGRHEEGEATFRADPRIRRLEWGREGHDYRGWLSVAESGGEASSSVTIHLETHDDSDPSEIERVLDETLANIERAVGRKAGAEN